MNIGSDVEFGRAAMEVFARQAVECAPYREYLSLIGVRPRDVDSVERIPFLPIGFFKTYRVYCDGAPEPEAVFASSATGGVGSSRHHVARLSDYERTFRRAFGLFYGDGAAVYALLPGYREGSSLIYMVRDLIARGGGGFYLDNDAALLRDLASDGGRKILFGVSHALLDLAERHPVPLGDVVVMETGGMKGRREELSKEELHRRLCRAFGVERIHSEYGMAELSSQAYSSGGGIFNAPPWMRVAVRDVNDPFTSMPAGRAGGINIIDLANLHSCAFIQTQDIGTLHDDGTFTIAGRADRSEVRGCNLLIQ